MYSATPLINVPCKNAFGLFCIPRDKKKLGSKQAQKKKKQATCRQKFLGYISSQAIAFNLAR